LEDRKIIHAAAESLTRRAELKSEVASSTDASSVSRHVRQLTKPNSPAKSMKKAGVALIAAPDPVTGVAGVALVASSLVLGKNEPASLANLAQETRKVLREIQSLRI
jgi:hypothetical protein